MKSYILGVDLGGTNIKAGLFDTGFTAIGELSTATEAAKGPAFVLERIRNAVQLLTEEHGVALEQIQCMGLGIPGLLDPEEGLSIFSPNFPDWENIHIVNEMKSSTAFLYLLITMCESICTVNGSLAQAEGIEIRCCLR